MKNLTKLWSLALLLTATMFMVSCDEDEPTIDVDEDGLALADGYYFAVEGQDPTQNTRLQPETVEGEEFAAVEREGFFGNYVFLSAGDYNLVSVVAKEITSTLGGSLTEIPGTELTDDEVATGYDLAIMEEGGGQINIANDGFFKISYDETTSELIVMEVETVSIIGSATENGWSDTELNAVSSSPEDGVVLEKTGMIMGSGEFKIRINNGWKIIRTNEEGNGYVPFTNYGGSVDNLVAGGGNIAFGQERAEYTVEVTLTNDGGAALSFTNTGEAPEITFDPNDYQWAFVGNATADNWAEFNDRNMVYKGADGGIHKWVGVATFAADGAFKFRANDAWDVALGGSLPADGSEVTLSSSGGDIPSPGAGDYYVVITTADEGATWNATMTDAGWGVIGDGSPQGNWDADMDMVAEGFTAGVTTYTITGDFTTGLWKFRAGDDWALNLGGTLDALTVDGGDLSLTEAGNYTLTLSFDGNDYTATAIKN